MEIHSYRGDCRRGIVGCIGDPQLRAGIRFSNQSQEVEKGMDKKVSEDREKRNTEKEKRRGET